MNNTFLSHQHIAEQRFDAWYFITAGIVTSFIMKDRLLTAGSFLSQPLYAPESLRQIFDRVAQCSVMRLNKESMDKLYDLMIMVCKFQVIISIMIIRLTA